jgi:glycosyltransferase involved in cell wall biosynthesis
MLQKWIRSAIGKVPQPVESDDFALWVSSLIFEFEKIENVELHVIAPHSRMTCFTREFSIRGVHYYFFNRNLPYTYGFVPKKISLFCGNYYIRNRLFVKRFLKQINPDIVNLIGTENPDYCITGLDIKEIPVYATVQTVYSNPDRLKLSGECDQSRWDIELQLHRKVNYYGTLSRMHQDLILKNNPGAMFLKHTLSKQMPKFVSNVAKTYDFVLFAANVVAKKGVEDALHALARIKTLKHDVRLNVVGECHPEYKAALENLIKKLDLVGNVEFHAYFPLHADMVLHIQKSSFAVLPNKLDAISGTVIEAMALEIPVVTYRTADTPSLNKDAECVLLADIGDIDTLAAQMTKLLETPLLANTLVRNAKAFVEKNYDSAASARQIIQNYRAVIDHYMHHVPIPKELLFE